MEILTGQFLLITGWSFSLGVLSTVLILMVFGGFGRGSSDSSDEDKDGDYKEKRIRGASNFDELNDALDEIGQIQGSKKSYNPDELKGIIRIIRAKYGKHELLFRDDQGRTEGGTLQYMSQEAKTRLEEGGFHLYGAPDVSFELAEEIIESYRPTEYITNAYGLRRHVSRLLHKKFERKEKND